ncbi:hypothetical protein LPJ61_000795 [Coemansia biformis]|uniref:Uncharacterized protein n=1 Tax=Coemansia biformis TaxID=1286918 RepID=A0A9W8D1A4_9FUNG|nr:hypothetical protein LPJ61_000795 [Coemansia biformis]
MPRPTIHVSRVCWQRASTKQLPLPQPLPGLAKGKRLRWTKEQDEQLRQLVAEKGRAWTDIAAALGIAGSPLKARSRWSVLQPKNRDAWTKKEDDDLARAVQKYMQTGNVPGDHGSWVAVARMLPTNRTPAQCHSRWTHTLLPRQGKRVTYTRFKKVCGGVWDDAEAARLRSTVDAIATVSDTPEAVADAERKEPWLLLGDGTSDYLARQFWVYVASQVGTRTAHQCIRKWQTTAHVTTAGRITTSEARRLAELVRDHGRKWQYLASAYFPERRPVELYRQYSRWCLLEKRHGVDLLGIDPFSRIRDYNGVSALRPTGEHGGYDPSGRLARVFKSGPTSAMTPYVLAIMNVWSRRGVSRKPDAIRVPGGSVRAVVPSDVVNRLFAALARHRNDWVSVSRSVGIPAPKCRMYADILAERLPSIKDIIRDSELEQLADDHSTPSRKPRDVAAGCNSPDAGSTP